MYKHVNHPNLLFLTSITQPRLTNILTYTKLFTNSEQAACTSSSFFYLPYFPLIFITTSSSNKHLSIHKLFIKIHHTPLFFKKNIPLNIPPFLSHQDKHPPYYKLQHKHSLNFSFITRHTKTIKKRETTTSTIHLFSTFAIVTTRQSMSFLPPQAAHTARTSTETP